jgi:hypothetical protein
MPKNMQKAVQFYSREYLGKPGRTSIDVHIKNLIKFCCSPLVHPLNFRSTTLSYDTKTTVEWGLICVPHNLKKRETTTQKQQKITK